MSNIEKDIEKLESIVKVHNDFLKGVKKETISEREIKALENVLAERKQDKERIKELEAKLEFKKWGDLDNTEFEEYMRQFIPVQKVKDISQKNRNELFSVTYLDPAQYKPFEMQLERINKIEKELLEDK